MKSSNISELGPYFTFLPSKSKPIYNWFYYKEAFSPEVIEFFLNKFQIKTGLILDPFCGIGTTLLYSKSKNLKSAGYDISPLSVFVSRVKCEDYSKQELSLAKELLKEFSKTISKSEIINWNPELFPPNKIFPKSNLNFILRARNAVESIENKKIHNLFLLALLSTIPQCSLLLKDGGVLKYDKRKIAAPAKHLFKRKIKRMLSDLEKHVVTGPIPKIEIKDAKEIPFPENSIDAVITSPPYLNNIDYTKVYGIELSLFDPFANLVKQTRKRSLHSFDKPDLKIKNIPPEAEEFGVKYPVIGGYFSDMEKVLKESYRTLKPNSSAAFIVGNSIMYGLHILVDEILGEIGERIGFEAEIITSLKRTASTPKTKIETRESAVVFRKS